MAEQATEDAGGRSAQARAARRARPAPATARKRAAPPARPASATMRQRTPRRTQGAKPAAATGERTPSQRTVPTAKAGGSATGTVTARQRSARAASAASPARAAKAAGSATGTATKAKTATARQRSASAASPARASNPASSAKSASPGRSVRSVSPGRSARSASAAGSATGTGQRTVRRARSVKAASSAAEPAPRATRRARPAPASPRLSPAERVARGKAARATVPREAHAALDLPPDRPDPIVLLEGQAASRVPELVPIRYGRMLASPFSYFRGAALPMAADLANSPASGITVQACGDAHLSNFGFFASPERRLVFDVNDFDETLPGPWEWDVKRLAASLEIAGRDNGFSKKQRREIVVAATARYRNAMRTFAGMNTLDVWYARADVEQLRDTVEAQLGKGRRKMLAKGIAKAQNRSSMQELGKLTAMVDGRPRIVAEPPLIVPLSELLPQQLEGSGTESQLPVLIASYARTLEFSRRILLKQFEFADMARKVVGVGSVGTRCWIVLMLGRDETDPLFLQVKEAQPSVLSDYAGASTFANEGERVVAGQRLMQAVSDIFLGWQRINGLDGQARDFYIRQLRDWKASIEFSNMVPRGARIYGETCGWTLARAHARSGDRIAIDAYLGTKDVFDQAIADFAVAYADQNETDYRALVAARERGRIIAETNV